MSQTIPDRSLVNEIVMEYVDALYATDVPAVEHKSNGHANH